MTRFCHKQELKQEKKAKSNFPEQKELGKEDYVVICGDFGGVWETNRLCVQEPPEEKNSLDWLENKP